MALYTRKPRVQRDAEQTLEREGETRPIISDLQGRNRIEYKTFKVLKETLEKRHLSRLPYMKRWREFAGRNTRLVEPALQVFREIRASGRSVRPRVIVMVDGTGILADDLLAVLSQA